MGGLKMTSMKKPISRSSRPTRKGTAAAAIAGARAGAVAGTAAAYAAYGFSFTGRHHVPKLFEFNLCLSDTCHSL